MLHPLLKAVRGDAAARVEQEQQTLLVERYIAPDVGLRTPNVELVETVRWAGCCLHLNAEETPAVIYQQIVRRRMLRRHAADDIPARQTVLAEQLSSGTGSTGCHSVR